MAAERDAASATPSGIDGPDADLGGHGGAPQPQDARRRGSGSSRAARPRAAPRHRRNVSVSLPIILEGDESRSDGPAGEAIPGLPAAFARRSRSAAPAVPEAVAFNLLTTGPFGDALASGGAPPAFDALDRGLGEPSAFSLASDGSSDTGFSMSACSLGSSGESCRSSLSTEEVLECIMGGGSPFEAICPAVASALAGLSYREAGWAGRRTPSWGP